MHSKKSIFSYALSEKHTGKGFQKAKRNRIRSEKGGPKLMTHLNDMNYSVFGNEPF